MWGQMQGDKIATTNSAKCHVILHIIIVVISQIDSNANLPTQASFRHMFVHIITSPIFYVPRWHVSPVVETTLAVESVSACRATPCAMAMRSISDGSEGDGSSSTSPASGAACTPAQVRDETKGFVVKESYYVTLYVQVYFCFCVYDSYVTWICKYEPWISVYIYIYTQ